MVIAAAINTNINLAAALLSLFHMSEVSVCQLLVAPV